MLTLTKVPCSSKCQDLKLNGDCFALISTVNNYHFETTEAGMGGGVDLQ
jgi:hypothetical protein